MDALRKHLSLFIATFGYSGLAPKAPGTMGSLAALPFAWFLWQLSPLFSWGIFMLTFLVGTWAAQEVVDRTKKEDNQCIVIDEALGIFLCSSLRPLLPLTQSAHPQGLLIGFYFSCFILFRFFDILKPGPVRWADRNIKGGLGVIVDDLVAALLAMVILLGIILFVPLW